MAHYRKKLGDFGERMAAAYLQREGMALVERQWRGPGGEIDLVMREGQTLVFVEVRTRRGAARGTAAESVGQDKRRRLAALAYAYLEASALPDDMPWRIDVVAIDVDSSGIARLSHLRSAVEEL